MRTCYFLLVAFLILSTSYVYAQSQSTTPSHLKQTIPDRKSTDAHKQTSEQQIIKVGSNVTSKESQQTPANDPPNSPDKTTTNIWIMRATVAIAIFAFLQFLAMVFQYCAMSKQIKHLKKTVRATKEAADAARKNAEALPEVERSYLFIYTVEWFREEDRILTENGTDQSTITVWVLNAGKTPAVLRRLNLDAAIRDSYPTREEIHPIIDNTIPDGKIMRSTNKADAFTAKVRISTEQWGRIEKSQTKLLCYGRIEYKDIFGKDHATGFCYEWSPHEAHRCFYISNNKDLNYYT